MKRDHFNFFLLLNKSTNPIHPFMRQQRPHGFSKAPLQYCYTGIRYQHKFLETLIFKTRRCGHGVGESTASLVSLSPTSAPVERVGSSHSIPSLAMLPACLCSHQLPGDEKEVSSSQYNTSISPEKDRTPRKFTTGLLVHGEQADGKQAAQSRSWLEKRNQKWEAMGWLEGTLLEKTQVPDLEVCFL